jgi:hypothetical protein
MSPEKTFTLTMDEVDEINLKMSEALAMAEVLSHAAMGDVGDAKLLYTYTSLLEEKLEAAKERFSQAISKGKEAA